MRSQEALSQSTQTKSTVKLRLSVAHAYKSHPKFDPQYLVQTFHPLSFLKSLATLKYCDANLWTFAKKKNPVWCNYAFWCWGASKAWLCGHTGIFAVHCGVQRFIYQSYWVHSWKGADTRVHTAADQQNSMIFPGFQSFFRDFFCLFYRLCIPFFQYKVIQSNSYQKQNKQKLNCFQRNLQIDVFTCSIKYEK